MTVLYVEEKPLDFAAVLYSAFCQKVILEVTERISVVHSHNTLVYKLGPA